ncbi:uncharacterized protein PAC_18567 [Phialocephala subalpina]|uniref:Uncharacterized protein n=1 Tax=Phialocephala subalpina TaxID=576137 RepID=A0A1L7XUG0_9HELO|nr:uncharacterized protein PAC_18567 [Phialocephala subalpina]
MPSSGSYNALPQTPRMYPPSDPSSIPGFEVRKKIEEEAITRQNHALKSKIRRLRFFARFFATALAVPTLILETQTLTTFYSTHNTIRDGRGPWAKQTSLWPAIMLVSASGVTVLLGLLILAAYTWGSVRSANKVNTMQTTVTVVVELVHIGLWIAVSVLYREGKNGKDLWGWACSGAADKIQKNFEGVVDFNKVCNRGTSEVSRASLYNVALDTWTKADDTCEDNSFSREDSYFKPNLIDAKEMSELKSTKPLLEELIASGAGLPEDPEDRKTASWGAGSGPKLPTVDNRRSIGTDPVNDNLTDAFVLRYSYNWDPATHHPTQ